MTAKWPSGPVNFAQAITSFCAVIFVIGGVYWWAFEKDQQGKDAVRQYNELSAKIDANEVLRAKAASDAATASNAQITVLTAAVSKVDGKIDAYGATTQATAARLDRVSDKLDRAIDDQKADRDSQKTDRQERLAYQQQNNDHVNAVDGRLRVVECLRPGGKCQ